jgi:hypothetical protein
MGWTLDDVWELPVHYYEFLIDELNAQAEHARPTD